jgi:hypothetical protein
VINLFGVVTKKEQVEATGFVATFFTVFAFYFFGIGINNVFETFPYMMGFSSTRREFYLGLLTKYVIMAGTFSGFILVFFALERIIYRVLGLPHVAYLNLWGRDVSGLWILVFIFAVFMFMQSVYNLFSLMMNRFRMKQFFLISAVLSVIGYLFNMVYPVLQETLVTLSMKLIDLYLHLPLLPLTLGLVVVTLLVHGIGWLFIRRAEVKVFNAGT